MDVLWATLQSYREAVSRAAILAARNWPVAGSLFAYVVIGQVATQVAIPLGILGGFLVSFVSAACIGSFLYLVEQMMRSSKVTLQDFGRSFGVYLWDVVGVMFVLFMGMRVLTMLLIQSPQGPLILFCVQIVILVVFNAVPELIYLGHNTALQLLSESYRFIADNWIEWFPPNIILLIALWYLWSFPLDEWVPALAGIPANIIQSAVVALFVYFAMIVRGLLFRELSGSSRRGRAFRRRMGM